MVFPEPPEVVEPAASRVVVYLASNGAHLDWILPVRHRAVDWTARFPRAAFPAFAARGRLSEQAGLPDWVAIGWGDREFYLNTPTWKDLTFKRAIGAVVGRNSSLLHVAYVDPVLTGPDVWQIALTDEQYGRLVAFLDESMVQSSGVGVAVPNRHYGRRDAFFEGTGRYHAFRTCNSWVGEGLRAAGQGGSRWTPFPQNVTFFL